MKKILFILITCSIITFNLNFIFAIEDEYEFGLDYTGEIVKGVEKSGSVTLKGTNAPVHTAVRIKVDLAGPATPRILATDSNGTELDIATLGYWGPESGFTVGNTFTNVTPIKATYPQAGTYTTTLTLIDVNDPNAEYAKRTFTINVVEETSNDNTNNDINNDTNNNTDNSQTNDGNTSGGVEEEDMVTKLPQTGNNMLYYIGIPSIPIIGYLLYRFGFLGFRNRK